MNLPHDWVQQFTNQLFLPIQQIGVQDFLHYANFVVVRRFQLLFIQV